MREWTQKVWFHWKKRRKLKEISLRVCAHVCVEMKRILTREIGFKFCNFCWEKMNRLRINQQAQEKIKTERNTGTHTRQSHTRVPTWLYSFFLNKGLKFYLPSQKSCFAWNIMTTNKQHRNKKNGLHLCAKNKGGKERKVKQSSKKTCNKKGGGSLSRLGHCQLV